MSGQCPPNLIFRPLKGDRFTPHLHKPCRLPWSRLPSGCLEGGFTFQSDVCISPRRLERTKQVAWLFGAELCPTPKGWRPGRRGRSCFAWLSASAWRSPVSWLRVLQKTLMDDRTWKDILTGCGLWQEAIVGYSIATKADLYFKRKVFLQRWWLGRGWRRVEGDSIIEEKWFWLRWSRLFFPTY